MLTDLPKCVLCHPKLSHALQEGLGTNVLYLGQRSTPEIQIRVTGAGF